MSIWNDVKRLLGGKPVLGGGGASDQEGPVTWESSATPAPTFESGPGSGGPQAAGAGTDGTGIESAGPSTGTPAVQVLTQGPLTDLKRMSKYLGSVGIESQMVMPPGGCGT